VGDQLLITILKLNAREAYLVQSVETYCECPGIFYLAGQCAIPIKRRTAGQVSG